MTQTADLIHKMAEFFKSEEFFEKGEDARLELSPDDVRCMNEIIKALPSVKPQTGHWIIIDDCEKFIAKCSECGQIEDSRMIGKYAYCHCGAKMFEPQERSE